MFSIPLHIGPRIAQNNGLFVIDCWLCGYAHLEQLPKQQELDYLYGQDEYYKQYVVADWFAKEKLEHRLGLWKPYYDWQTQLLLHQHRGGIFVDVGAGAGWYVQYLRERGQEAYGVEPSKSAREVLGCNWLVESLKDIEFRDDSPPALVSLRLTLEHLLDPVQMLENCAELAGKRGRLLVVIPNEFNPLQRLIVKRREGQAWFVQQPHVNYFTKKSLVSLINQPGSGLKVIDIAATFPMELMYFKGYHYIGDDKVGRRAHNERLLFERRYGRRAFVLYRWLNRVFGIGRELMVVAEVR